MWGKCQRNVREMQEKCGRIAGEMLEKYKK